MVVMSEGVTVDIILIILCSPLDGVRGNIEAASLRRITSNSKSWFILIIVKVKY